MTRERPLARPAAHVVWLLAVGVPAGMLALIVASPTPEQDAWAIPLYSGIVATWGLMGPLLVTRRPDNRVGWVLLAVGLGIGLALLGRRARVQRVVDRRFNRARVDAQRAIDAFGAHFRDDVGLTALHGRLIAAADATVQPNGVGLWIRGAGR